MILNIGVSVRTLMESASYGNLPVCGIDYFGDIDSCVGGKTKSLALDYAMYPNIKNLLEIAESIPCEAVVYTSGPENMPELLLSWEKKGLLRGNGYVSLKAVRNPFILNRSLQEIDMEMPQFFCVEDYQKINKNTKYLLKPTYRGSGHGISFLPKDFSEVKKFIYPYIDKESPHHIIEEYIPGIPASVTFLATGKCAQVIGTSQQLIFEKNTNQPFCYQGNIVPLATGNDNLIPKFNEQLDILVKKLTLDFELKGLNTLDFILYEGKIYPLELNPRWSASVELIEQYLSKSLYRAHLSACMGECVKVDTNVKNPQYYGKLIVYNDQDLVVSKDLAQHWRTLYENGIRDLPRGYSVIKMGEPLCTVLAHDTSSERCYKKLQKKAQWIQKVYLEGMFFRESGVIK